MKTTPACWRALFAEKKLKHIDGDIIHLNKDDRVIDEDGDVWDGDNFSYPPNWEIYEPPKWEDNIPEGGVICQDIQGVPVLIIESGGLYVRDMQGHTRKPIGLTPCTKAEIQVWKDNAPE